MPVTVLPRRFYARPTVEVARALLGCVVRFGAHEGVIVETEAYLPEGDEAAHAWRGRTPRTAVLFGPPGHAYVFLNYGVHHCLNVVCEPEGVPGCVLVRAVAGWGDGPGKLTRHAGITLELNGADVTRGPLTIHRAPAAPVEITVTPRIGIRRGRELPLRFLARLP
jgi:DNA-3-methyladenine glycosylase